MRCETYEDDPDLVVRNPAGINEDCKSIGKKPKAACMLSGLRHFSDLPIRDRERILPRIAPRSFEKDEHILHYGDQDRNVCFVISGRVKAISYSESGKQVSFEELGPGDIFGEIAAIDGLGRSTDITATSNCLIGVMSHSDFMLTNMEYPEVAWKTMQRLTRLTRKLLGRIMEFSTLSVSDRVAAELIRIAESIDTHTNIVAVENPPTHEEIAFRISTHREAVTREIKRLESEGVITWNRSTHRIDDLNRLREIIRAK